MSVDTKQIKFQFQRPYIYSKDLGLSKREKEELFENDNDYHDFINEQMTSIFNLLLVSVKKGDTILLEGSGLDLEVVVDKVDRIKEILNTTIVKSNQTHEGGWVAGVPLTLHHHIAWFEKITVV
jgi:hypothetical protein